MAYPEMMTANELVDHYDAISRHTSSLHY